MRKAYVLVVAALLATGFTGSAASLSLCDYRSPSANLRDMRLSFNYRYFDNAATEGIEVSSGRLAVDYNQLYESDNMGITLSGNVEISLLDLTPASGIGHGVGTFRYYILEETPLFGFGGLEAGAATGQPQPNLELRAGMGYGRFSDVTPLAKALNLQRELLRMGTITERLPDEAIRAIADQIGQRSQLTTLEEVMAAIEALISDAAVTPLDPLSVVMVGLELNTLQSLVTDIETLIEDASGASLDADALLLLQNTILEPGNERKCGWAVQGGIGYDLITNNVLFTFSADAALVPDPASQILLHSSFSGPSDILEENALTFSASYAYSVNDHMKLFADYRLQRVKSAGEPAGATHAASFELAFDLGGADLALQVALTKDPSVEGWSTDVMLSMAIDLL